MGLFPEARPSIGELGSGSISPTTFISEFILQGVPGVLLSRHTIIKRQLGRAPEKKKQPCENIPRIHSGEKYYSPVDTNMRLVPEQTPRSTHCFLIFVSVNKSWSHCTGISGPNAVNFSII